MQNNVAEYKSVKSNSTYTVTTENGGKYRLQTLRSCQMKAEREARYA